MSQDVLLWVGGIAASIVGTLGLILLTRLLRQGDDTNSKVTALTEANAVLAESHRGVVQRVGSLEEWRLTETERQLADARARAEYAEKMLRERP
jgi:hypothetical protein